MSNGFIDLGISSPILQAIEEMGFEQPTEVQSRAIPPILQKKDLIVMSKTGSGKTAVFGVSMLQLTDPAMPGPQGLILTPTRELAVQVDKDIKLLSKHLQHRTTVVYGQHSMSAEIKDLKSGATIVTGTPGRVFDHIRHGNLQTKNIRFLVLDEADRMLDMGFLEQVVRIIRTIPKDRVTLLFSATIPPEVRRICSDYMKNPEMIEIESQTKTVDTISQIYYRVAHNEKNTQLNRLLLIEQPESCMIFCNTRVGVDRVQSFLTRKGYASQALHGDIPQGRRIKTIDQFKQGEFHLLVATDVAARGIHIDNLSLVINYDVPVEKDSYVHRIGRTGRAGNVGRSITLVTVEDIMSLYAIEEHIGVMIEEAELPSEEVFRERSAAAGEWLKANALKAGSSRESSGTAKGRARGKRQSGKPAASGQSDRQTDRSAGTGRERKERQPKRAAGQSFDKQNENTRAQYSGERKENIRTQHTGERRESIRPQHPGEQQKKTHPQHTGGRNPSRPQYSGERIKSTDPSYSGDSAQNNRTPYADRQNGTRTPHAGRRNGTRTPYYGGRSRDAGAPFSEKPQQRVQTSERPSPSLPEEVNNNKGNGAAKAGSFLHRIVRRIFGK